MNHYVFSGLKGKSQVEKVSALNSKDVGIVEEHIMSALSHVLGVSESDIRGKRRYRVLVDARHMYCAIMRRVSLLSLSDLARRLRRNHSTIIHSLREHNNKYPRDVAYTIAYEEVLECINSTIKLKNVKDKN